MSNPQWGQRARWQRYDLCHPERRKASAVKYRQKNREKRNAGKRAWANDVLSGKVKHYTAKEATNAAGKIIAACKVQLDYAMMRQERPCIDFLGGEITPIRKQIPAPETD